MSDDIQLKTLQQKNKRLGLAIAALILLSASSAWFGRELLYPVFFKF
jgi:hypothetical protein